MMRIDYVWNKADKTWNKDTKILEMTTYTETSDTHVSTTSKWDTNESKWELAERYTSTQTLYADFNIDNDLYVYEIYDRTGWNVDTSAKWIYVYAPVTGVEDIVSDLDISVFDGGIRVTAAEKSVISIYAESGANIASGRGSVSASVAPGIYLISIDGKAVKILVR